MWQIPEDYWNTYEISSIERTNVSDLQRGVRGFIREGWTPWGPLQVVGGEEYRFVQLVVQKRRS